MCHFSHSRQLQALLVLVKGQLLLPKPQLPLTALGFCAEWEMQERLGLSGLPLHCAALKANTSTWSPGFVLTQAEFLVDWAHWSRVQSLSAAVRVVNTNSMLRVMPQALEGPWGVQVIPWVLGSV